MAPPPPYLMPELIDEILLRFPPDDPACLVRASLVCKPWRRRLCDRTFRRRYRAFHRAPPLLGFLHNHSIYNGGKWFSGPRVVSTTTPSPLPLPLPLQAFDGWHVLDCRHGRVLFVFEPLDPCRCWRVRALDVSTNLAVWDSATCEQKQLPEPPFPRRNHFNAAVLCAVRACDHLDCHGGPFLVVFVGYNDTAGVLQSHLYSSESSAWSSSTLPGPCLIPIRTPSVLIGNDIYLILAAPLSVAFAILNIDPVENNMSIINAPEARHLDGNAVPVLVATEDGSLGFTAIFGSTLRLWTRNSGVVGGGGAGWAPCRVIELQTLIPFRYGLRAVGSVEGFSIVFVASYEDGVFSLDLKSLQRRKVVDTEQDVSIFPFMAFYTPVSDGSSSKMRLALGSP